MDRIHLRTVHIHFWENFKICFVAVLCESRMGVSALVHCSARVGKLVENSPQPTWASRELWSSRLNFVWANQIHQRGSSSTRTRAPGSRQRCQAARTSAIREFLLPSATPIKRKSMHWRSVQNEAWTERTWCPNWLHGNARISKPRPATPCRNQRCLRYYFVAISVFSPRLLSPFRVKNISQDRWNLSR